VDYSIHSRLAELMERGNTLLSDLRRDLQALNTPGSDLVGSLLAEGAGKVVSELLGSRRAQGYGRKLAHTLLRQEKSKSQQAILGRYYGHYRNWFDEVVGLLSQVSVFKPKLVAPGNSNALASRVGQAESFKNLDTRIRHVLRQLEHFRIQNLVWNSTLPKDNPMPAKHVQSSLPHSTISTTSQLKPVVKQGVARTGKAPQPKREIMYFNCFISYGQPDLKFAKKLCADLQTKGVSCWLYDVDSMPGQRTSKEISAALSAAEKVVVLCSANSLVRDGILKEIEKLIDETPDKIVPISLDELWKHTGFKIIRGSRDLKPFLLDRNYADFASKRRYPENLDRLLMGLRRP